MKREMSLLKTVGTAVLAFVISWCPYCICVLFFSESAHPLYRKVSKFASSVTSLHSWSFFYFAIILQKQRS